MPNNNADSVALRRAATLLGGTTLLRDFLGVSASQLVRWMDGVEPAPDHVFLKTVELVVRGTSTEETEPEWREPLG